MLAARAFGRRTTALVALAVAASVLSGCSSDDEPQAKQSAAPTPITSLNTGAMQLARIDFCSRVPASAVKSALDGHTTRLKAQKWRNGSQVPVVPGAVASATPTDSPTASASPTDAPSGTDLVREIGCRWTASGGWSVAAWMFSTPTTLAQAQAVIVDNRGRKGCTPSPGPGFGTPSQRLECTLTDGSRRARVAGLFNDVWLTCEVQGPSGTDPTVLRTRSDAWCVHIANALNTTA